MVPLSILIWVPVAVALVAAALPRELAPRAALLGTLAAFGISVAILAGFDSSAAGLQDRTDLIWISQLGLHYKLGIDGLNLFLVLMTTFLFAVGVGAANLRGWERPRLFYFQLGLAESAVLGAFLAQDLALFYGFFDLMLVPFYFLCGQWGERQRVRATTKLIIYTFVGSFFMLAGVIGAGIISAQATGHLSFAFSDLRGTLPRGSQEWIFLCFAAAFVVKMPLLPFQGWMPDAYRSMPLPVLAIFSAVLSKVAAYGFLRIVLPIFPQASVHFQLLVLIVALASILYGSAMAFTQTNLRLIIGYSSVAQLGFITLGIFSLRATGGQGAILQMVNHGLVTAALLLIVILLAARAGGSEDIREMGGIAFRAPVLAGLFLIVALATLAMPGSSNFIGEFLILLGVFQAKLAIAVIAFTGVVLASVYMLRAFIRAMHNRVGPLVHSRGIGLADAAALVPVVLVILGLAFYPQFALRRSQRTVDASVAGAQALSGSPPAATAAVASRSNGGGP